MSAETFRVAQGKIVHESIDGEVVIINLETGAYYSLTKSGAHAWEAIVGGTSRDLLVERLSRRYEGSTDAIASGVDTLIQDLLTEEIIVAGPAGAATAAADVEIDASPRLPFELPAITKFSNMSDLLLLDPIHDVDEQGWPNRRAD